MAESHDIGARGDGTASIEMKVRRAGEPKVKGEPMVSNHADELFYTVFSTDVVHVTEEYTMPSGVVAQLSHAATVIQLVPETEPEHNGTIKLALHPDAAEHELYTVGNRIKLTISPA